MKPKILVTRLLPKVALDKLSDIFDLELNLEDRVLKKEEIIAKIRDKQALLCLLTDTIDQSVMNAGDQLKVISNYAVGFNNIDLMEASKRKIPVCITPGILTETTADLTFALILSVMRRIVEADIFTRQGHFKGWGPGLFLGAEVNGKTLGIIGMGRIGQAVAKRAQGFNMKILYHAKTPKNIEGAVFTNLETLLSTADIISLHIPLTPDNYHLIDEKAFDLMKTSAYLINTTRGPVVDEKALVKALKDKKIAGAGLDVYEDEPLLSPGLIELDNVVLLPHIGSATIETRSKMAMMAVENAIAIWQHKKPHAIANPEVLATLNAI